MSHTHQGIFKFIQFLVLGDEITKLNSKRHITRCKYLPLRKERRVFLPV